MDADRLGAAGAGGVPLLRAVGADPIAAGLTVLLISFDALRPRRARHARSGRPTETLVVGGLYRYVRNPMYLAVASTIVGQALLLWQPILLGYAAVFLAAVASFVHWYEEPTLGRRFGAQYEAYRRAVPAWRPRRHPWEPR